MRAGVHDLVMVAMAHVWVLEFARIEEGKVDAMGAGSELHSRMLGSTRRRRSGRRPSIPDPDNVIRASRKGPLMGGTVDSKGNVYAHWMLTGGLASTTSRPGKASTFRIPTPGPSPTERPSIRSTTSGWPSGTAGRSARFNTTTNTWTEFMPPIFPANFRRGPQSDAEGNIWTGIWAAGKRPGKMASWIRRRATGRLWDIPYGGAQPYETSIDRDGNIWFPDTQHARPADGERAGSTRETESSCCIRVRSSWPIRRA